jgi:hypothetical protein
LAGQSFKPTRRDPTPMKPISTIRNVYWKLVKRYRPITYLRHRSDETWHLFDADLANAKSREETNQVEGLRKFECAEYDDEIRSLESHQWMVRAKRVHLGVYDIPLAEHEQHWDTGVYGTGYLSDRVFRVLKKQVEDAEYERDRRKRESREIRIKYFTAVVAFLAALASIANLIVTAYKSTPGK